jgi:hypothetical protein
MDPRLLTRAGANLPSVSQRSEKTPGASLFSLALRPAATAGETERATSKRRTYARNRTVRAIGTLLTERLRFSRERAKGPFSPYSVT